MGRVVLRSAFWTFIIKSLSPKAGAIIRVIWPFYATATTGVTTGTRIETRLKKVPQLNRLANVQAPRQKQTPKAEGSRERIESKGTPVIARPRERSEASHALTQMSGLLQVLRTFAMTE